MSNLRCAKRLLQAGILGLPFLFVAFLCAQTDVEKATRETDRTVPKNIEEKLRRTPEKPLALTSPETPVKKEEQKFFIKEIKLAGCESFSPQSFSSLTDKYQNKEVSMSELEVLAREIEREYLRRGVIAAVFAPPQEIRQDILTLQVVEARMGELKIQKHKYFKQGRLNYYWKVPPGKVLRYDKISKSIQLMNKNPDREVKAALHAGTKPGTTDVLLTPKTNFPIHALGSFDNEGSTSTGTGRIGYGLRHNNFLGLDDTLLTGYTFGRDFDGFYTYHTLPVSSEGASLVYGYSKSASVPTKEYQVYGLTSKAKTVSVSLHQDIYNKDSYVGEFYLGFDAKDKTTWMVNTNPGSDVYTRDRLRILRLGGNFVRRGMGSNTYISPEVTQGVKAFGASNKGNPLASRKAKSVFSKFTLGVQHKRVLPLNLQANLKMNGQYSSCRLTPQEEFSLGGMDSVRGYPSGDYLADNAFTNSIEILIPAFFIPRWLRIPYAESTLKEQTTPLVFMDYGWGKRRGALVTEKKAANLLSVGAGTRIRLFNQALLRLEWGFPLGSNHPITEEGESRFHFSVDFQEKLPEEIERIRKMAEEENIKQCAWQLVNEELNRPSSPLRKKILNYRLLAAQCQKEEKFQQAKELYQRIAEISRSLYQQAEEYVKGYVNKQKELREKCKLAKAYYEQGKTDAAKQLWQKISAEAVPQPLVLEF